MANDAAVATISAAAAAAFEATCGHLQAHNYKLTYLENVHTDTNPYTQYTHRENGRSFKHIYILR